ncbi:MAG: alpha-glucosidase [Oscillospiraceae bacterium]|nr:alpha-glucosidase [Oscillospiraceae bacterium]
MESIYNQIIYINPYLVEGGQLYAEAAEKRYFVRRADGSDYLFDFGEFNCGVVDLTMPEAFEWYKQVIRRNLIGMGFRGWMADFGEYLPADAVCCGGSGLRFHNEWPALWARCNREAVEESGKLGECVFFMRAGATGSQRSATLIWAGDQCVDWSDDDGLPSVVTAALTLGMSGFGLHCSDTGGYTTLFGLRRSEELLVRWLEFSCFTPVMRTHEGNRPDDNVQLYDNERTLAAAARWSGIHTALLPYMRECVRENAEKGAPVMRPLFWDCPDSPEAWRRENYSYMLGNDMIVCPVTEPGCAERRLWLPDGDWRLLWSGERFNGGEHTVSAPLGKPPVFCRAQSRWAELFARIAQM